MPERAEQPPVRRAVAEDDAAAFALATLPEPGSAAVDADGGPRATEEPSRGAAAPAPELRRGGGGGGARVEGRDGVGEAGEGRGRGRVIGEGGRAGGTAERGLEAVDDGGGDLHRFARSRRRGSVLRIQISPGPWLSCAVGAAVLVLCRCAPYLRFSGTWLREQVTTDGFAPRDTTQCRGAQNEVSYHR